MKKLLTLTFSALFVLGVMASCQNKKEEPKEPPKALNVIYFIGDGTALPQVYAGMLATRQELVFPKFPYIGVVDTHSANKDITDSAAGGTALASDHKTNNLMVGMNPDTIPVKTLLEVFHEQGKETGLVVTSYITHATPASFYAKVPQRKQYEDIALQLADAKNINLAIGGGRKHFNQRQDSINLIERMENELGWKVYDTLADVDECAVLLDGLDRAFRHEADLDLCRCFLALCALLLLKDILCGQDKLLAVLLCGDHAHIDVLADPLRKLILGDVSEAQLGSRDESADPLDDGRNARLRNAVDLDGDVFLGIQKAQKAFPGGLLRGSLH